ncbi:hypothetical protein [Sneathiella glossodoripedis]|uniref:hypothetical protein n=1 Tax=Sneathiella glossodoripedis TaxID=418853 RepID=UPI00046F7405|nr:hypothetical protein [Sneathiella glossodoripedis]
MKANLERIRVLMKEIQNRVAQIEASFGRGEISESLKAHDEALKLKHIFAVERASFGLAQHEKVKGELGSEFETLINKVNGSLNALRKFTREFASRGILGVSNA